MIVYAFDLGIWTILFFLFGMYKPEWPLFFLKKPDRFMVLIMTTIFVMLTFTLYGEGTRREKVASEEAAKVAADSALVPVPVPASDLVPVPTPNKDKPVVK